MTGKVLDQIILDGVAHAFEIFACFSIFIVINSLQTIFVSP